MEKIDRKSTKENGESKSVLEANEEIHDKLDEIVEWINKQEAEKKEIVAPE